MNSPCPTCGTLYTLTPQDAGRRLRCKRCAAPLTVTADGLAADTVPPDAVDATPAPDLGRRGRRHRPAPATAAGPGRADWVRDLGGVPTLLFAAGALVVVVFLFHPLIGAAAVQRAQAAVERLDLDWKAAERKLRAEGRTDEQVGRAREEFDAAHGRAELDAAAGYEAVAHRRARWAELYGLLVGFLLLTAGAVGLTGPGQPAVRRALGAVVLAAVVVVAFAAAAGGCGGAGPRAVP